MMFHLLSNGGPAAPTYKINYTLTNVGSKRQAPLIRMSVVWGDDGLNIPPKTPPKILLDHETFKGKEGSNLS